MPPSTDRLRRLHDEAFLWALSRCGGHRADAEDVLQEVYLKVLEGDAGYDHESSFKTWLFSVIKHTAADTRRHTRRERPLRPDDLEQSIPPDASPLNQNLNQKETTRILRRLLGRLSERQEEALRLVFYHDLTIEAASEVMDVALGTARTHYERGKQRLRDMLSNSKINL